MTTEAPVRERRSANGAEAAVDNDRETMTVSNPGGVRFESQRISGLNG